MRFDELLVLVHVFAAIVWVGGAIGFEIIAHRTVHRGDDGGMKALAKDFGAIGVVSAASSAVVLGFGIWAVVVHSYVSFSDTWIWLSLAITGILFLLGPLFFAPTAKKLIVDSEAKGGPTPMWLSGQSGLCPWHMSTQPLRCSSCISW